jgi:hypothetical protein
MANVTHINIYIGSTGPTDEPDRIIVDYDDNTQRVLLSSEEATKQDKSEMADVSSESTKIKNIYSAFFS